ncbi:hypothetical protein JZ751_011233 [Albula glossodonta]|uniref:Uncharacterized protein n=1 Tax=Albula glossodonta TaxID=121402 RepID=A0A8T2P4M3_9TELE|nr:hypothetical protein JZ751_011233 [Albula glossodonta]
MQSCFSEGVMKVTTQLLNELRHIWAAHHKDDPSPPSSTHPPLPPKPRDIKAWPVSTGHCDKPCHAGRAANLLCSDANQETPPIVTLHLSAGPSNTAIKGLLSDSSQTQTPRACPSTRNAWHAHRREQEHNASLFYVAHGNKSSTFPADVVVQQCCCEEVTVPCRTDVQSASASSHLQQGPKSPGEDP